MTNAAISTKTSKKFTGKGATRKLTKKQKDFAKEYIETGNGRQSALKVYNTKDPNTAAVIASENINKPNVKEYIESHAHDAAIRIKELSDQDENLPVALGASKDILDRAGYKPVEKSQTLNLNVSIEPSERIKELAKKLKELDNEPQ